MKYLYSLLLLPFFYFNSIAQKTDAFSRAAIRIDSIPKAGILLDKGWKWHASDNPDFAKVDFDDSKWESIDPTKDIFEFPQISKTGEIGWFRLKLSMDEVLLQRQISLIIQQSGASEIFLNGLKIVTNGTIDKHRIEAKDPLWKPFPINLHDNKQQTIAIRYALQPKMLYTAIFENYNPIFWIKVMDSEEAVIFHYSVTSRNLIFIFLIIGISLMIFFIHFSFYLLYPDQKANLYFSLFSLFFLLGSLTQYFYWLQPFQASYKFYLGNLAFLFFIIAYCFLLTATYLFLEKKKDFFYYFLLIFSVIAVFLNAYPYGIGWKLGGPMQELFVQINIARIAVLAVRKKQKGSWIIAIGAFSTLVVFIIFLSQGTFTNSSFLLSLPVKRMIFYFLFCLSLPVSTSLFLAFQFADISLGLKRKIIENEALSTEKQHILATQNETLEKQVEERTVELRASQAQLIQKEKLASLGELTAAIAHEIQNPLNFVNNFSELSVELLGELKVERQKGEGKRDFALEDELLSDLSQNQEKINHHGKRASSIVKGMLEHSRKSTGEKELTDINALADEYLRLAYHGLRAKDSTFNSDFKTDFDESLPKILVIPQDIGRVLLNLINNAFYACAERSRRAVNERSKKVETGYEPKVTVSTQLKANSQLLIAIKDNGSGMSEETKAKIFQPFFTTKPTGEGTGLGLSLAYDIITKGHGGTIECESVEGEGTEFIVKLPIV